jgi:RHH-type rel operon transcriptional repressor/antitoxin RelB
MTNRSLLSVDVPPDLVTRLDELAKVTGRSRSELAEEALVGYLSLQRWQVEGIEQSIAEADAGEPGVSHERVVAWVRSWDTDDELPPPTAG